MSDYADLIERLRAKTYESDGPHGIFEVDRNPDGPEAADALAALTARVGELEGGLRKIADGTMPRPLGEPWRMDQTSSKHDRCVHGQWMYEPCEGCIDAFIASTLGEQP